MRDLIFISATCIGAVNCAIATTLAIERYKPSLIINQGCAGGDREDLELGDIVVANKIYYGGAIITPLKGYCQGSNALDWKIGSYSDIADFSNWSGFVIDIDPVLCDFAMGVAFSAGKLHKGAINSSDFWNREKDRIAKIRDDLDCYCEEMESFAAGRVCESFGVSFLAYRAISNNHIKDEDYLESTLRNSQEFTEKLILSLN